MVILQEEHNMQTGNMSFENAEQFRHLGSTLKNKLKSGNVCSHAVQNLLSSSLLSKYTEIKIHRTIILLVVLYGCETGSLTLREEHRLCLRIGS